MHYFSNLFW